MSIAEADARALGRVRLLEALRAGDLVAAARELLQRRLAAHQVQRSALVRARFGEEQRAAVEVERGVPHARRDPRALLPPAQPAGDHQVDHQEQVALELED